MTDPISALLALLPPTVRVIVSSLLSLIVLASMIVGALPVSSSKNPIVKFLRILSGLVHHDEDGTIKLPFSNYVIRVGVTPTTPTTTEKT